MKRLWIVLAIAGIAIIAVSAFHYFTRPGAGDAAPAFELLSADGKSVNLEGYRGSPVLLHFWASWCGPCQWELPRLAQAVPSLASEGLAVLAVSEDDEQNQGAMLAAVREAQLPFPVLLDGNGRVADAYESWSVPETFFIDREGVIRWRHAGPVDWTAATAREKLQKLMAP